MLFYIIWYVSTYHHFPWGLSWLTWLTLKPKHHRIQARLGRNAFLHKITLCTVTSHLPSDRVLYLQGSFTKGVEVDKEILMFLLDKFRYNAMFYLSSLEIRIAVTNFVCEIIYAIYIGRWVRWLEVVGSIRGFKGSRFDFKTGYMLC